MSTSSHKTFSNYTFDRIFFISCDYEVLTLVAVIGDRLIRISTPSVCMCSFKLRVKMQLFKSKWFAFFLLPIKFGFLFFLLYDLIQHLWLANIYCIGGGLRARNIFTCTSTIVILSELFRNWWQLFTANTHIAISLSWIFFFIFWKTRSQRMVEGVFH